jgi:hypothetical protein
MVWRELALLLLYVVEVFFIATYAGENAVCAAVCFSEYSVIDCWHLGDPMDSCLILDSGGQQEDLGIMSEVLAYR